MVFLFVCYFDDFLSPLSIAFFFLVFFLFIPHHHHHLLLPLFSSTLTPLPRPLYFPPLVVAPPQKQCKCALDMLKQIKDPQMPSARLCQIFIKLPSRKELPSYYEVISNPVDINSMERRIYANEYTDFGHFVKEFELLVNNAQTFNAPESEIYKDSILLKLEFDLIVKVWLFF